MKTLSITDQVALWCIGVILPAILIPTTSSRPVSPLNHFPVCALALYLITIAGVLLSIRLHGGRFTERQVYRRVILLQTIPIWGLAATWGMILFVHHILLEAPNSFWLVAAELYGK
jgi:hypothetical protein